MSAAGPDAPAVDGRATHFDDDEILHKQIDSILRVELHIFVENRNGPFGDESQPGRRQLELQARHAGGFEQARTKNPRISIAAPMILTGDDVHRRIRQHAHFREQFAVPPNPSKSPEWFLQVRRL